MEFLGIGPLELILIVVLALIIFGPRDIEKAGKSIGRNLNKLIRSDTWKTINQTSQELKNLPIRLMRESGLEELEKSAREELENTTNTIHQTISIKPEDYPPAVIIDSPADLPEGESKTIPEEGGTEK
jgi:sec-independent protein translocase protein TatB